MNTDFSPPGIHGLALRKHNTEHNTKGREIWHLSSSYGVIFFWIIWRKGTIPLRWRHNDHDGVSNHQPHGCLLNRLFRRRSKKTSKLRVTGLCVGNSPGTGEFPAQMASYAENVSIWWRHHGVPVLKIFRSTTVIWWQWLNSKIGCLDNDSSYICLIRFGDIVVFAGNIFHFSISWKNWHVYDISTEKFQGVVFWYIEVYM